MSLWFSFLLSLLSQSSCNPVQLVVAVEATAAMIAKGGTARSRSFLTNQRRLGPKRVGQAPAAFFSCCISAQEMITIAGST